MHVANPGWFEPRIRLPRKGQEVWVITREGSEHAAVFDVQFTSNWPSGASWVLPGGNHTLPFEEAQEWAPREIHPNGQSVRSMRPSGDGMPGPASLSEPAHMDDRLLVKEELTEAMARTAKLFSAIRAPHLEWTPHPSILPVGKLACRVLRIVARIRWIIELDSIDRSFEPDVPDFHTANEIVSTFATDEAEIEKLIKGLDLNALTETWTLQHDSRVIASQTRGSALRSFGLRPLLTHHAEIALLLTALNANVPFPLEEWTFASQQ